GVTMMLEAIRHTNESTRFYQASSSELFGNVGLEGCPKGLDESSAFRPASPYAAAKLYGHFITSIYREAYGLFAVNGILFNHESPLRGLEFVTRRISNAVAKISLGLQKGLTLGNLKARRDWGYAPEYVEAMWKMLQQDEPEDYVIATGESHSVEEFAKVAFQQVGLEWSDHVREDESLKRPLDVDDLRGDCSKANKGLDWKPKTTFKELVAIMVDEDIKRWKRYQNGEMFPWDAASYPEKLKIKTRSLRS
ncbi:MAG: GDP-mannose 4,6-dehydratase, partial [Candidatus Altiarchaeota archaeon]